MKTKRKGPGKPKGYVADRPNKGSKLEAILAIIRDGRHPPADLDAVRTRAERKLGGAVSRSLLYKVRRYLTPEELKTFFPG